MTCVAGVLYFNSAKNECDTTRRAETCGDFRWWFRWHHTGEGTRAQVRSHAYRHLRLFQYVPGVPGAIVGSKPLGLGSWATHADSSSDQVVVQNGLAPRSRLNQLHRMIKDVAPISAQFLRAAPSQSVIVRHGTLEVPLQGKSSSATMETITWDHLVFATGSLYPSPFKPSASQSEYAEKAERKRRVEHSRLLQVKLQGRDTSWLLVEA